MSQYTPVFGASGTPHSEGSVPDPGSTAGTSRFLREDSIWAVPSAGPPGPTPPSPGPGLDQWACNAAGFILYECCYKLTKAAIDSNFFSLALDAIVAFAFDSLAEVLLPLEILDTSFLHWLESTFVAAVQADLATFLAHIEDQALWSKFHCFLYNQIRTAGNASNTTLLAAGIALAASGISPGAVTNGVALILQQFGIMTVGPIPLSAFVQNYDCSTCAGTGADSAPIPIQAAFDLIVTDGTNEAAFVDKLQITPSVVSGNGHTAHATIADATSSAKGIVRPDNATLQIIAGVLSVLGIDASLITSGLLATNRGGLGIDTSSESKGAVLSNSGSAWGTNTPGSNGLVLTSDNTQPGGVAWATPAGGSLTSVSTYLTSNVTIISANTYVDAVSATLAAGVWYIWATMQFEADFSNGGWQARLTDGTTVFANNEGFNVSGLSAPQVSCAAVVNLLSSTLIHWQGTTNGGNGNTILSNINHNGTGHVATYMIALKIG